MNQQLKLIVPLTLFFVLLLTGCELRRADETGDITIETPEIFTPTPPAIPSDQAPTTEEPTPEQVATTEAAPADIDPVGVPAALPPAPDAAEPNMVLVKLTPQAAVQARAIELAGDDLAAAGLGSLEQRMQQFGDIEMSPVISDEVVNQNPDELSVQSQPVVRLYAVSYSADAPPDQVAAVLNEDPAVEYAEPNFIAGIAGEPYFAPVQYTPNDPYYKYQWHFGNIQMPTAWDVSTGQDVIVAVVDTGINFAAPDLAQTNRLQGYDFVNNDNDPTDDQSHGTHVAGTIAQSTNNGAGVAGVAFNARLLPVKVLGSNGNGTYENIIKGIVYAVDQGAKVINMSLAGSAPSQGLQEAVKYAYDKGVVVVAAAGNSNGAVAYPATYDTYVIAVSATRFDNTRAPYSNFGPEIDIAAPGGDVDVDQNGDGYADGILQQTFKADGSFGYLFFEGTSMASPHVAGVSALLLSKKPGASPAEIESILTTTATNLGSPNEYGAGLVQAAAALAAIAPQPVTATPTNTLQPPAATNTPTLTPIPPTATPTVAPVCTPPPCAGNEVVICPGGDCPGGCGVICATITPQPVTPIPPSTNTPTPTPLPPTATPTPTPAPPSVTPPPVAGDLLVNSSFETDEGWLYPDTPVRGQYSNEVARSGSRSAKLGITDGRDRYSFTSVWQQVTIPAEANTATLTAHVYPISKDQWSDFQNILILDRYFRIIKMLDRSLNNSQAWQEVSYDLSNLRGQTIYIYFGTFNNGYGNKPTAMFVDDVSLTWSP